MSNYKTTLASPGSKEHEGIGGFFDEVYVKDDEGFIVGKFYGPTSWGLARKFIEVMDKLHANDFDVDLNPKPETRHEINFVDQHGNLIHFFFDSIKEREEFMRLNPSWRGHVAELTRQWGLSHGLKASTKTYAQGGTLDDKYWSSRHPIGLSYAVFNERRKTQRPENWMYGIPLHQERRAQ